MPKFIVFVVFSCIVSQFSSASMGKFDDGLILNLVCYIDSISGLNDEKPTHI